MTSTSWKTDDDPRVPSPIAIFLSFTGGLGVEKIALVT